MELSTTQQQGQLKGSVYALEHPEIPGLYFDFRGDNASLKPRALATLAPATPEARAALAARAIPILAGQPHELVRLDR